MNATVTKDREAKVKAIRDQDIIPVLENALNYGSPWDTLYVAAIEEITELRKQVVDSKGAKPDKKMMISMKNNLAIILTLNHDAESNVWVMRLSDEVINDMTTYFDNGWYALDESSSIRIING